MINARMTTEIDLRPNDARGISAEQTASTKRDNNSKGLIDGQSLVTCNHESMIAFKVIIH